MQISFERSGGFANIRVGGDFNLDDLPADQANSLRELLEKANFMALPEQLPANKAVPDQFTYTITVQGPAGQHTVVTGDRSAPDNLRPLIQKLTELARSQGK